MAVAYVSTKNIKVPSGAAANATSSAWDITSATNPVIVVHAVILDATQRVSSVSWSAGGTGVEIKTAVGGSGNADVSSVWAIPAPTSSASGTVTVNLTASATFAASADLFQGADQTTPCPTGDTWTDITSTQNVTANVPNLTANDASAHCCCNSSANISSVGATQTLVNNAGSIDIGTGYATGTTQTSSNMSSSADAFSRVAVRIVAVSTGPTPTGGRAYYPDLYLAPPEIIGY